MVKVAEEKLTIYKDNIKQFLNEISYLRKSFIVFLLIYGITFYTIIRANFNYIDDLGRVNWGYGSWTNFSRFLTEFLSKVIHTSNKLADISPLTQIIAIVFLSISSCIVIHLFNDNKKVTFSKIIAVLPLGISPFFLQCISYKYDSPYMALSILVMLIPFIFIKLEKIQYKTYFILSIIGTQ